MDSCMDFSDVEVKVIVEEAYIDDGANSYFITPADTILTSTSSDFNPELEIKEEDIKQEPNTEDDGMEEPESEEDTEVKHEFLRRIGLITIGQADLMKMVQTQKAVVPLPNIHSDSRRNNVESQHNKRRNRKSAQPKPNQPSPSYSAVAQNAKGDYGNDIYTVEKIMKKRVEADGSTSYLIKWLGWESKYNNWEPQANVTPDVVQDFERELVASAKKTKMDKAAAKKLKSKNDVYKNSTTHSAPKTALLNTETRTGKETLAEDSVTARKRTSRNSRESSKNVKRVKQTPATDPSGAGGAAEKSIPATRKLRIREATTPDVDNPERRQLRSRKTEPSTSFPAPQIQETQEDPRARAGWLRQTAEGTYVIISEKQVEGRPLKEILGITELGGDYRHFLVAFRDTNSLVFVRTELMNNLFPMDVIRYYENQLVFRRKETETATFPVRPASHRTTST